MGQKVRERLTAHSKTLRDGRAGATMDGHTIVANTLALIDSDMARGKNIGPLPRHIAKSLRIASANAQESLSEITGDVRL